MCRYCWMDRELWWGAARMAQGLASPVMAYLILSLLISFAPERSSGLRVGGGGAWISLPRCPWWGRCPVTSSRVEWAREWRGTDVMTVQYARNIVSGTANAHICILSEIHALYKFRNINTRHWWHNLKLTSWYFFFFFFFFFQWQPYVTVLHNKKIPPKLYYFYFASFHPPQYVTYSKEQNTRPF